MTVVNLTIIYLFQIRNLNQVIVTEILQDTQFYSDNIRPYMGLRGGKHKSGKCSLNAFFALLSTSFDLMLIY
jgi:hypothetical protein